MLTDNLPLEVEPRQWSEYFYHRQQVDSFTRAIASNRMASAYFVSGPSGTGKTTAIKLFIKAVHCQRRQPGEFEACNSCTTCQLDPRTSGSTNNVLWIQAGKDDSLTTQFNKALEEAYLPPWGYDEPHRFYKFIVFEELQSIPLDKLQALLFYPELSEVSTRNRVVFIFNTMNESKIEDNVLQALQDRGDYLRFRPLSEEQISDFLMSKFPEVSKESSELIAMVSKGSFRRAIQAYKRCKNIDPYLSTASVADALNFATPEVRKTLYALLKSCTPSARDNYYKLDKFWKQMELYIDIDNFIEQMDRDIDLSMIANSSATDPVDQFTAQKILFAYKTSKAKVRAFDCIKMLAGKAIFDPAIFNNCKEELTGFKEYFNAHI